MPASTVLGTGLAGRLRRNRAGRALHRLWLLAVLMAVLTRHTLADLALDRDVPHRDRLRLRRFRLRQRQVQHPVAELRHRLFRLDEGRQLHGAVETVGAALAQRLPPADLAVGITLSL